MNTIIATAWILALLMSCFAHAKELRIAAWNLEHLNANGDEGCVSRTQEDYDIISDSIDSMGYDVVALQEVKDVDAARRVFAEEDWNIEMSKRAPMKSSRECWGFPDRYLQHLGTGFAIRKGIQYERNHDFEVLGLDDDFQRWGTDITILEGSHLRLLSVHLKSGCWGPPQDEDENREETCDVLRQQITKLVQWRDERRGDEIDFAILGDFNRRLAMSNDWGWNLLSPSDNPLFLVTADIEPKCDSRYTELIDHIVVSSTAITRVVEDSAREGPRVGEHPDHCAVSALFQF